MSQPSISIVTCTYNSERFLEKCLKSVENQTYTNIEHIFNDSYSTDNTVNIINDYIKRNKHRYPITFFQTKPKGIARALNDAYPKAKNEIIHFLHSDDYYYESNTLEKVASIFDKNKNIMWLTGNGLLEYKNKIYKIKLSKLLNKHIEKLITITNFISHENTFVKTCMLNTYGGFDEQNKITIEYRLWLKMIEDYKPLIVDEYFTVFIVHPKSASTGSVLNFSKALFEVAKTLREEHIIPLIGKRRKYRNGVRNR